MSTSSSPNYFTFDFHNCPCWCVWKSSRWWPRSLGPESLGKIRRSPFLVLPNSGCCNRLGSEPEDGRVPFLLCLSLSNSASLISHFLKNIFHLFEKLSYRKCRKDKERSSICCVILQMTTMVRLGQPEATNQKLLLALSSMFRDSSNWDIFLAFPGSFAGSWGTNGAAGTWISAHMEF